ncbi:MAG: nucleotide exchange factor GrpE [Synergistaceae bacterium]|nr:nucleotide exchange factor GrpE [Synergistaceae bacterium]
MNENDEALQEENETENEEVQPEITEDDSQKEIENLKHELAVSRADFYNFRQRTIKERQETRKRAQEEIITEILPVLDNLDRALEAASAEDSASILKGVEMVQRQFVNVLENLGVSIIKAEGENFDPSLHDASGTEKVDDPELDGKIIRELLKGYRTSERVLRPAQVTVGKI